MKTIKAKDMFITTAGYGHQKIMENSHKDDLLQRDYDNLKMRIDKEVDEFKKALVIYRTNRTERNAEELRREGGDIIAFVSAIMAKSAGYESLIRE
jgi:hypothetical protein